MATPSTNRPFLILGVLLPAPAFACWSLFTVQARPPIARPQGVTDLNGVDFYTDPQIHTRNDQPSFGRADLREQGIRKFFETHECSQPPAAGLAPAVRLVEICSHHLDK